ncbi:hypothetical protein C8Q78DRAFT_248168 [Trametes maxima]|nr:hypothetical protein C8Q78DRAFT_248168 [Trametes maxima]
MENCMLPIEICWDIIEAIPASSHFFTPPEYDALVACSLVCRTWNTRAEDILRLDPELDTPQIASQFASTIRRESSGRVRADHISELWLNWSDFEGDKNLSRAMELFMTPLPRLESLHMFGVHIDISPRILRCMSPPLLTGMTHLEFLRCKFCSWRAMLDIVWGCLKLDLLSVENCSFGGNTVTPESIARLGVSRRSLRGCQYLKTLVIMADTNMGMLLPGDVFGDTLMQLALHIPCDALEDITPLFRGTFPRLESIQFWISTVSHEVVYHGARLFCALATGPSPRPTLHSIFINLPDHRASGGIGRSPVAVDPRGPATSAHSTVWDKTSRGRRDLC